jgi:hypothetical protein
MLFVQGVNVLFTVKFSVHYEFDLTAIEKSHVSKKLFDCLHIGKVSGKLSVINGKAGMQDENPFDSKAVSYFLTDDKGISVKLSTVERQSLFFALLCRLRTVQPEYFPAGN